MKLKKLYALIILVLLSVFLISGCLSAEDIKRQQENIELLKVATANLKAAEKRYEELKADYIAGKVDLDVWAKKGLLIKDDIEAATKAVSAVTSDIKSQNKEGQSWWEIALAGAAALAIEALVRGIPSKGLGGVIANSVIPSRRKKED